MGFLRFASTVLILAALVAPAAAQSSVRIKGEDITITGCVARAGGQFPDMPQLLVWSRGDLLLTNVAAVGDQTFIRAPGVGGRVFFWLEDDEDLSKHIGQRIEIKGDLEEIEKGEVEIDRDDDFTEIKFEIGGKEAKARVPTSWLGPDGQRDQEFDIVARKVDVDDIRVLGPCLR